MLYRFKSKACGDVIMLQPHGQQLLQIIGKHRTDDPGGAGILLPEHMAQALTDLDQAIASEEQSRAQLEAEAKAQGVAPPRFEGLALRHRATPLKNMIQRAMREDESIVWNV